MANLIDTINSKVSNIAGQTGSGTNYGIKKRTPVIPAQTTPGGMSVDTGTPIVPTIKGITIKAPITPPATNNSVTGAKLAPVTPIVLPEQVKDNTPSNLSNAVTSDAMAGVDTYTKELEAIKNKDTSGDVVANLMKSISGVQASEETLANQLGKDTNLAEYNRLASDLELEKNNARRQIEDIQKSNPTGALRGGQLDQIANIERDSARKQGDLAFEANARLGAYDKAVSIAKKQVEMEVAPLKAELDRLQYLQDYNKEFRTAEIDAVKLKKQNQIKREEDRLNESNKLILNAIQSKAPQSMIDEAKKLQREGKSTNDIATILGNYSISPADKLELELKRAQIGKINKEAGVDGTTGLTKLDDTQYSKFTANPNYKAIQDGGKFYNALDTFKKATEKWGTAERLNAKGRGELNSDYMSLVALTKDYYTLGTLDAGVEKLVSLGIPKPGTYSTRDKVVLSAIDASKKQVLDSINNSANQLKKSVYGNSVEFNELLSQSLPNDTQAGEYTEEAYVDQLLTSPEASPFNAFK